MSDKETKKKSKSRQRIFMVAFMFAVTVVFISGVSFAYLLSRETIKANEVLYVRRAILNAAGIEVPQNPEATLEKFNNRVQEIRNEQGETLYYEILDQNGESTTGYVFIETGAGLWGAIRAAIGFEGNMNALSGVVFIEQNETPGLGGRITEEWFTSQFPGKMGPFTLVPEGEPTENDEFDAVTGATVTSTAMRDLLKKTINKAEQTTGGK